MPTQVERGPPLGELYLRKPHPQNGLLTVSEFERHCVDRGLSVDKKLLETLEREGAVRPLLRVKRAKIPYKKIKTTEGEVEREIQVPLADGDDPAVATDYEYDTVTTDMFSLRDRQREGLIIFPEDLPFRPWREYRDGYHDTALAFYHPLQALMIRSAESWGKVVFQESILNATPEELAQRIERVRKQTELYLKIRMNNLVQDERLIRFLLVIEDALLPDLRLVFSGSDPTRDIRELRADWWGWRRGLDWNGIIAENGWSTAEVKDLYTHWSVRSQTEDPMEDWYLLVSNIPYDRRKKLKGSARLAQDFYEIAMMLKTAFERSTGEQLPSVDDVMDAHGGKWKEHRYGTRNVFGERKARLQLLTDYGLNPVIRVHLILEGITEEVLIESLAAKYGLKLEDSGIEVHVLEGVGNLRLEHLRFLLWHAVNEGGVGYVIVDDDPGVRDDIDDLLRTSGPSGEPLLRKEFHRIWKGEVEDENFTIQEVVFAFNQLAESLGSGIRISPDELEKGLVSSAGKPKKVTKALKELAWQKCDFDLEGYRKRFAGFLADIIVKKIEDNLAKPGEYKPTTPIEEELQKVANLANALESGVRLGPRMHAVGKNSPN